MTTIFALSSGAPPAAIAIIRVSGPRARMAVETLAGGLLPPARRAQRCTLRDPGGEPLDDGLLLWFPGPHSATGEDLAEFHLHGGRAVVAAIERALANLPGLRRAEPGEFTRRAFSNGRIDLAQAEGLADLLSAETELQRRSAHALAGGAFSRRIDAWRDRVLMLSAQVEAALDFSDEHDDDPHEAAGPGGGASAALLGDIEAALAVPSAEALREGFRVALAGPPNSGKSTLFNALIGHDAAITSPVAGTTRDTLIRPVAISGVPFTFIDMAGLRERSEDPVEMQGIARARDEIERADLVLWLGPEGAGPDQAWEIDPQCDRKDHRPKGTARFSVSAVTGTGLECLVDGMLDAARGALPKPGEAALNQRQREHLVDAANGLRIVAGEEDLLLAAEGLRSCRAAFDTLLGRTATEEVLDTLFGRFCIGK